MAEQEDGSTAALENAAEIYFGRWVDVEVLDELPGGDTPESLLMEKELIQSMPSECVTMLKIISNLPEELYRVGGGINTYAMKQIVKNTTQWPWNKVYRVEATLLDFLRKACRSH